MIQAGNRKVIIVSAPGIMQQSLRAVLAAMPGIEVTALAGGCLSALALVHEKQPDLVVVDCNQPEDEVIAFLKDVKRSHPGIRLVALTQTTRQGRRILDSGADAVLSRWSPAREFASAIDGDGQ
jgi:two-component system invasion response regulator UvrY